MADEKKSLADDSKITISMVDVIDRIVQYANRYKLTNVDTGDVLGTFDFEEETGTVTTEGTEINREVFESIRASFDEAADQIEEWTEEQLEKLTDGDLKNAEVTLADTAFTYDGTQKTQAVEKVTLDGEELKEGVDYLVVGNHAINAGSYAMAVVGIGEHAGVCAKVWSIAKAKAAAIYADVPTILGVPGFEKSFTYTSNVGVNATSISCSSEVITATLDGNTVTIAANEFLTAAENVTLTFSFPESENYEAAEMELVITVTPADSVLENNTWEVISVVSNVGYASEMWDVGDMHSITLNGKIGEYFEASNLTLYVYILGFDHNADVEGVKGITFQGFKNADGKSIALIDSNYNSTFSDGTLHFNLNHWGSSSSPYNTNYGGWISCDARYDIFGSTDVAPSGYGATKTTDCVGYDPTEECTAQPVENTLMAAIPEELRSVLKCVTKYTDNTGNSSTSAEAVTASLEYIFLLAEWEIFGARTGANSNEQSSQAQYEYWALGNDRIKHRTSDDGTEGDACGWWERSPYSGSAYNFCIVSTSGDAGGSGSRYSYGLAPGFVV